MKILFVANTVAGLYKEIESEMIRKGHEVITIYDCMLRFDPSYKFSISLPYVKKILWEKECKRYWRRMFKMRSDLNDCFDLLFVLSGASVTMQMVSHLKSFNPKMRTVLYTWDGCKAYNFGRHFPYMDKCYTFEIIDALKDDNWNLLPIFYHLPERYNTKEVKYDLFSIGSSHDGRYTFIKKLLPQLSDISFYVKIVSPIIIPTLKERIMLLLAKSAKRRERLDEIAFSKGKENSDLLLRKGLSLESYMEILTSSRCVLDDQREGQSGLTARFMWALGAKKKIVTTNQWALKYKFVSPKQVCIISKDNPLLSIDFLKSELKTTDYSDVSQYEISNWVDELLRA